MSYTGLVERLRGAANLADAEETRYGTMLRQAADALAAKDAEIARLVSALDNICTLAAKRQNEGGPDGNLADIEGFARAALEGTDHAHD
mgnify:CR=1 FL=1